MNCRFQAGLSGRLFSGLLSYLLHVIAARIRGPQHTQRTLVGQMRFVGSVEFHFFEIIADGCFPEQP